MSSGDSTSSRLQRAIDGSDFGWSLSLIGEDQAHKLAALTGDLHAAPSSTGDGKRVASGFAYWGIAPAIAWAHACTDPFYPVMQKSIESFAQRWRSMRGALAGTPYHYVSLGSGTGHKDRSILADLWAAHPRALYVPVDMSGEMLRLGRREALAGANGAHHVVPVQLDFSIEENLAALKSLLHHVVGDEPILYSLLGNTAANFDDDVDLLRDLTELLRPQDRFLLEVATTSGADAALAERAAGEYERSRAYKEFVTSALMHYTDLSIGLNDVEFVGEVEPGRALRVKVLYRNSTGEPLEMTLPDRATVPFPNGDTIRLYLTRKYLRTGLAKILDEIDVRRIHDVEAKLTERGPRVFGLDLVLFATGDQAPAPTSSRATDLWSDRPR